MATSILQSDFAVTCKTFTAEVFVAMRKPHRRMAASLFASLVERGSTLLSALALTLVALSEGPYVDLSPLDTLSRTTGALKGRMLGR